MASLSEMIMQQVTSAAGGVQIPANLKNQVIGGLTDSILGGFTQTAAKSGGLDQIKSLLTGKAKVASSPVTTLATSLFSSNILGSLNLDKKQGSALTALIPTVIGSVSTMFKDQDGDGDVDLNDILAGLSGGGKSSLLGAAAKSLLGGLFKK
ncbi:MAG: hypothetical protein IJR64_02955 [Bacteroidales bacterium]|nr:hypothetical protein [Bacteroidales bacterium]